MFEKDPSFLGMTSVPRDDNRLVIPRNEGSYPSIKSTTMYKNLAPDVDSYISGFPPEVQKMLHQLRAVIQKAAPEADESISYMMPAYKLHGPLVYFGAYAKHIGFYPTGSGIAPFKKEIEAYKSSKGAVQFPLDQPLPLKLVEKMVKYRVKENQEKAALKKKSK